MYRKIMDKQEIYLCWSAGYGDQIAALPVIPFILDKHPQVYITMWVPKFFKTIARKSLPENDRLIIRDYSEKSYIKKDIPVKKFDGIPYTNIATHMTTHAYDILVNTQPEDINYYNYLPINTKGVYINRFELPERYFILPTGFTAPVREMRPHVVNNIIDYLLGKGYTPVFLGREVTKEDSGAELFIKGKFNQEINFNKGINLINKTEMLETVKIIQGAKGIVGLDNGLIHIAGTTDLAIVCGFSSVKSHQRAPYRHGVKGWNFFPVELTEQELACAGCQSNWTFLFNTDMRFCYYKDYKCLDLLTSDKYIKELEKILS